MSVRTVFKFHVERPDENGRSWVEIPGFSELLSVGLQNDELVVWALTPFDPNTPSANPRTERRRLIVANTGGYIPGFPKDARFLGTVTTSNGIVWHVWDGDA